MRSQIFIANVVNIHFQFVKKNVKGEKIQRIFIQSTMAMSSNIDERLHLFENIISHQQILGMKKWKKKIVNFLPLCTI